MSWINTRSGKQFHYLSPASENFDFGDMINSCNNQRRYLGHPKKPWTSLAHMLLVHRLVCIKNGSWDARRWAIGHDLHEGYLGDMPYPLKMLAGFEMYREIEEVYETIVARRLGIMMSQEVYDFVDTYDKMACAYEAPFCFGPENLHDEWKKYSADRLKPDPNLIAPANAILQQYTTFPDSVLPDYMRLFDYYFSDVVQVHL